jgi:UDP-N-acetylglucosamine/UDP-N-acetylgalactosamine diphosphorylase
MTEHPPPDLLDRLARHRQEHVLRWWNVLSADERQTLTDQLRGVDFELLERLLAGTGANAATPVETPAERAQRAQPPGSLIRLPNSAEESVHRVAAARQGRGLLSAGMVGAILVAGGQGTRLGSQQPKGMFPIGPVSQASLFQVLAEQLLARGRQSGAAIPYFIMTSDATHAETVAFFREHGYFGLNPGNVFFFQQGTMPAVDAATGRLLLAEKGRLSTSPDGHGGLLAALAAAGLLAEMKRRGIEYLYYHQVDNPMANVCDPEFLGLHVLHQSEMSTKVVAKKSPEERMGVAVDVDGRTQIIEYSDLPADAARRTDAAGRLLLWAGSTAIHAFNRDFLERLAADGLSLPFHVAHKAVPHIDESGKEVSPAKPNAYKFERFIFDALPFASRALVVEADRRREFNPVKNAAGDDSPATARAALSALHTQWLESAGATVAEAARIEISPLFALDEDEVRSRVAPGTVFTGEVNLREPSSGVNS